MSEVIKTKFEQEVQEGERFEFGKNWKHFLSVLNEERINQAEESIRDFLKVTDLKGKRFLDIGSGSGLFSLVARRMGAEVHSFDFDTNSVACTKELRKRYFPDDPNWTIEQGSVLDKDYIKSLGKFDICYSWGVLHHTGAMWQALYNANQTVAKDGHLFIAIYNDEGVVSAIWKVIKKIYCSGKFGRLFMTSIFYPIFFFAGFFIDIIKFRNPRRRYIEHQKKYRGMSLVHDWKDWLGGYPYEVSSSTQLTAFFENLDYTSKNFKPTEHGFGNNHFLFQKRN